MKKFAIILLSLTFAISCSDDYLDIPKEGERESTQFWKTEQDAVDATNAIYTYLRSWDASAFPYQFLFGVTGDDVDKGSNPGDASFINAYDKFTYTVNDDGVNGCWKGQWKGVSRANQVITNIPGITMDEALKTRLLAEARFLRAHFYFNLVRLWGGVPIFDGLPSNGNYNQPRNTQEEVYNFIISDLEFAANNLPTSYNSSDKGRATKGAALGYLAKVYLTLHDYQKAYDYSSQVMTMGYSLDPDYNHLFRLAGEFGPESIFEVDITCTTQYGASQYAEVQGVRNQWGWGFFTPSAELDAAYEPGDVRRELTFLRNGETTPEGDLVAKGDAAAVDNYNQKVYVPKVQQNSACNQNGEQNIRVLRYADILLINAEAANELGKPLATIVAPLNLVRNRAGLANTTATTQTALRTVIWHERFVELAMENQRFLDLLRTGQAATVLASKGFVAGKNELMPIPQDAINKSNGILTQNPGW